MSALTQCQTYCQVRKAAPHMCMLAATCCALQLGGPKSQTDSQSDRAINPMQYGRLSQDQA